MAAGSPYPTTPLDRAVDAAIAEHNARYLADPEAQRLAREQGDWIRQRLTAEGVLPPLNAAESYLYGLS